MAPSHCVLGSPGMKTPSKNPPSRPQIVEMSRISENCDPNQPGCSPSRKPVIASPATKSAKGKKSAPRVSCFVVSPPPVVKERKFIVAKKRTKKGEKDGDLNKCRQAAYEALRASQESFFNKDQAEHASAGTTEALPCEEDKAKGEESGKDQVAAISGSKERTPGGEEDAKGGEEGQTDSSGPPDVEGSSKARKLRSLMMEEAVNRMPEAGSGRVMHLVKAFESLLSIPKEGESDGLEESKRKAANWALPGLQPPPKAVASEDSASPVISSVEFFFPPKDLKRDSRVCSSFDSNDGRFIELWERLLGGREEKQTTCKLASSESLRSSWNKKLKVTRQRPFKLRTEQRGRQKEECFLNKVKEMFIEEERKRIPIAQGLPWTTDAPECLVKPPAKESTEPVDLLLHSDVRAVERAAFDQYVAERMTFAEQMKLERERQQKLEEDEEIRRLRKELVPRAQPMPYFDRPFVPKR
ncbi:hypothetical protein Taro_017875 [Colocasia esculenta]|uniref:TPX2 C-terminal domain-containing protein n=1 Tax=Colocasia esculenta TaxID=4460 RepID=A0A843UH93_COLES|nr:hypothetical protein [Colocasia esculenta]